MMQTEVSAEAIINNLAQRLARMEVELAVREARIAALVAEFEEFKASLGEIPGDKE